MWKMLELGFWRFGGRARQVTMVHERGFGRSDGWGKCFFFFFNNSYFFCNKEYSYDAKTVVGKSWRPLLHYWADFLIIKIILDSIWHWEANNSLQNLLLEKHDSNEINSKEHANFIMFFNDSVQLVRNHDRHIPCCIQLVQHFCNISYIFWTYEIIHLCFLIFGSHIFSSIQIKELQSETFPGQIIRSAQEPIIMPISWLVIGVGWGA